MVEGISRKIQSTEESVLLARRSSGISWKQKRIAW